TGNVPGPLGSRHPAAVPFQAFPTRNGYIVVAIITDDGKAWPRFCQAIKRPELADDTRFSEAVARVQNYDVLAKIIENSLRERTSSEWLTIFSSLDIPCGPVNRIDEVTNDPQIRERQMIAEIPHKRLGSWRVANTPFRFDDVPSYPQGPSPDLGEHTEATLCELLKLSSSEIVSLRSQGII
ncbi:MAG TPA: CoA transferase, partial [Candidatus Acidoferrales bacterium]|nr:CoA transferase [Candidatus Acidoferrales bacterium]